MVEIGDNLARCIEIIAVAWAVLQLARMTKDI